MQLNYTSMPAVVQVAVGRHPEIASTTLNIDVLRRTGVIGDVLGLVVNESATENLVVALQTSDLNTDADYATRQIRVDGSLVNSLTVPPRGRATFTVDGPNANEANSLYWRLALTDQTKAFGVVTLVTGNGSLELLRKFG